MKEEVRFVKKERASKQDRDDLSGPRLEDGKLAEPGQLGKERMLLLFSSNNRDRHGRVGGDGDAKHGDILMHRGF